MLKHRWTGHHEGGITPWIYTCMVCGFRIEAGAPLLGDNIDAMARTLGCMSCSNVESGSDSPEVTSGPSGPRMYWSVDGHRIFTAGDGCRFEIVFISPYEAQWGYCPLDPGKRKELNEEEYGVVDKLLRSWTRDKPLKQAEDKVDPHGSGHDWKYHGPGRDGSHWRCSKCGAEVVTTTTHFKPHGGPACTVAATRPPGPKDPSELTTPFTSDGNPMRRAEDKTETVNHPHYYKPGVYEVFRVLIAWGFHTDAMLWDALIYIARCKNKGNELEDLEKAKFWLTRKIEYLEGVDHTSPEQINKQLGFTKDEDLQRLPIPLTAAGETVLEAARLEGYAKALDDVLGAPGSVINIYENETTYNQLTERLNHLRAMKGIPTK